MKNVESVRRITNRMEMIQSLRSKLIKTRLSLLAVVIFLAVSVATNISLVNKLNKANEVSEVKSNVIETKANQIETMTEEIITLKAEIERLNSFDTMMNNIMQLEDICLEMASDAIEVVEGNITYTKYNKTHKTDLSYVDYVISSNGSKIRAIENKTELFVVYVSDADAEANLNTLLASEYDSGRENYASVISSISNVALVKYDIKF